MTTPDDGGLDVGLLTQMANDLFKNLGGAAAASEAPLTKAATPPTATPVAFDALSAKAPASAEELTSQLAPSAQVASAPANFDFASVSDFQKYEAQIPKATSPLPSGTPFDGTLGQSPPSVPYAGLSIPSVPVPGVSIPNVTAPGTFVPSGPSSSSASVPGLALGGGSAPQASFGSTTGLALPGGAPKISDSPQYYFLEHVRSPTGDLSVPEATLSDPFGAPIAGSQLPTSPNGASQLNARESWGLHPNYDVARVRRDFPILSERVNGKQLVWLDNAATTQKPNAVIERLAYFYAHENSNIHRAAHELAARATDAYEEARDITRRFLNARSPNEIVFLRGATEAINLVAQSWGRLHVGEGDEILVSALEHHANIVPWQRLVTERGGRLRVIPVDDSGQIILEEYGRLLNERTKLVSFTHVSNALGTITPAQKMTEMAHAVGAKVLIDGAQAVSHMPVDVRVLDPDFYVFSGHKVFAPTGIGVLYGREELLNAMPPWQGGGNMIQDVTFERSTYQKAPARFEAGTGNIADAVGLGAALDYVMRIGMHAIESYEHGLLAYGTSLLTRVPGLRLIGTAQEKAGVLSFVIDGLRTEQIGSALNEEGIAVRGGHHCAQPILRRFGLESTVRPSLAFYNDCSDLDRLESALHRIVGSRHKPF